MAHEVNPGYDPDRNLLSTCTKTILVWMVDFVMSAGRLKAIVCFDCASTGCQRRWRGLEGRPAFIRRCHQIFWAAAAWLWCSSLDYCQLPAFHPRWSGVLRARARNRVQMDEQNAGRLKISRNDMSQRIPRWAGADQRDTVPSRRAGSCRRGAGRDPKKCACVPVAVCVPIIMGTIALPWASSYQKRVSCCK